MLFMGSNVHRGRGLSFNERKAPPLHLMYFANKLHAAIKKKM